jgi:hypothetical protein
MTLDICESNEASDCVSAEMRCRNTVYNGGHESGAIMIFRPCVSMLLAVAIAGLLAACVREQRTPVQNAPIRAANAPAPKPELKTDDSNNVDTPDKGVGDKKIKLPPPVVETPPPAGMLMAPIVPLRTISGGKSAITELELKLATDGAAFRALWLRHNKEEAAPAIDFEKEMLVAVFSGNKRAASAVFHHVLKGRRYYMDIELGAELEKPGEAPFALFVMPKLSAPIVLEDRIWPDKKLPARFETLAVLQPDAPLLEKHEWWPVAQYSGKDSGIGSTEGKTEVVCFFGAEEWKKLWGQITPGKEFPTKQGGTSFAILGGKTANAARIELVDVLMGKDLLVFRFEEIVDAELGRDTIPYLMLTLPNNDSADETDVGLFFEQRNGKKFEGVDPKCVFIEEYRK